MEEALLLQIQQQRKFALFALLQCQEHIVSVLNSSFESDEPEMAMLPPPATCFETPQALARKICPEFIQYKQTESERRRRNRNCDAILANEDHLFVETHLTQVEFEDIHALLEDTLLCSRTGTRYRQRALSSQELLLLLLMNSRRYRTGAEFGHNFGISASLISKNFKFYIPLAADYMRPEISFPSPERIALLQNTIEGFPTAIADIDFTIQELRLPVRNEHSWFRGDKHMHFVNNLTCDDFTGVLLHVEPGYQGRLLDRVAFRQSQLHQLLQQNDVDVLGDRGFQGVDHVIMPTSREDTEQMANRARIECTHHELHSRCSITDQIWRNKRSLHGPSFLFAAQVFNRVKRRRLAYGLLQLEERVELAYE